MSCPSTHLLTLPQRCQSSEALVSRRAVHILHMGDLLLGSCTKLYPSHVLPTMHCS